MALFEDGSVKWWGRSTPPVWDDRPFPPEDLPVGATKLGGLPDLPAGSAWPSVDDAPHSFVAQVNLADVRSMEGTEALPPDGLLSFFYDGDQRVDGSQPTDSGGWAVLYTPVDSQLSRNEFPTHLPVGQRFHPVAVTPEPEFILPSVASVDLQEAGLSEEELRRLWELEMDADDSDEPIHRLLGHEQPVQHGHIQARWCQRAANGVPAYGGDSADVFRQIDRDAHVWRLLLQVDSDDAAGIQWGDDGRIFFWIRKEDLAARRFERAWLICQQH